MMVKDVTQWSCVCLAYASLSFKLQDIRKKIPSAYEFENLHRFLNFMESHHKVLCTAQNSHIAIK